VITNISPIHSPIIKEKATEKMQILARTDPKKRMSLDLKAEKGTKKNGFLAASNGFMTARVSM